MHRKTAVGFAVAAVLLLAFAVARAFFYFPEQPIAAPVAFASSTPMNNPADIEIAAAGVDAPIEDRGLVAGDRMQAPDNFTSVGWYEYGAVPGEAGTAVLYGHLDNGLGLNGVFKNLDQIKAGDPIQITTESGKTLTFTVSTIETYPYKAVPPAALGEGTSRKNAQIALITCAGTLIYDPIEGFTYDHRLIVTATYAGTS